jgi:hypothetical protein
VATILFLNLFLYLIFLNPSCPEAVNLSTWEISVRRVSPVGCPNCPGPITANVSICVRAGFPKPRPVPDTERNKYTKTLDYASTPLDANTLLHAVGFRPLIVNEFLIVSLLNNRVQVLCRRSRPNSLFILNLLSRLFSLYKLSAELLRCEIFVCGQFVFYHQSYTSLNNTKKN